MAPDEKTRSPSRYISTYSWPPSIEEFLRSVVKERPLLHVCSGRSCLGDVTMDLYEHADVRGDWTNLPFKTDSFASAFADPPWGAAYKPAAARFMREALRVAPVVYLMAPWVFGSSSCRLTSAWVRQTPGINQAIVLTRYERAAGGA